MTDAERHWQSVWSVRDPDRVTWFQRSPRISLSLIHEYAPSPTTGIVDVGGGASRLVDELLGSGYRDVTVLDVSEMALAHARGRLGKDSRRVTWIVDDVLRHRFDRTYDLWHDRAVFHFLIDPEDRQRYARAASATVPPGGHLVIATYGPDAPAKCSGLPVRRYDAAALGSEFEDGFELVASCDELHETPTGTTQAFTYGVFRRR